MKYCTYKGCDREHLSKGFCIKHYTRFKKWGSPEIKKCNANGEGHIDQYGYRLIYVNGKQVREHRIIMENYIGRKLKPFPEEIIHHKDGNKLNNDIKNLKITNQSSHVISHLRKNYVINNHKVCNICNVKLHIKNYSKCNNSKYKIKSYCKSCQNIMNKKRLKKSY